MSSNSNMEINGCIFRWKIENIPFSNMDPDKSIISDKFIANALQNTKWAVEFYPKRLRNGEYYLDFYLRWGYSCIELDAIVINFQIAILDKSGFILKEKTRKVQKFLTGYSFGFHRFEMHSLVFDVERERFFPQETLTVQCTIWKPGVKSVNPQPAYARTVFSIDGTYKNELCSSESFYPVLNQSPMSPILAALKCMFKEEIFSDTKLRTSTQTFSAHKNILSARSPVFRRMLSSNMKEKNSGFIEITDLDDDTVHRMLLYMYTDALDDLQFENACKLYVAADKYEILPLRSSCSTFLMASLSPTKVGEIIYLADRHQDTELKTSVQDFIFKHDREVFHSPEWKVFMDANSKLAAETMYRFTLCKTEGQKCASSHRYSPY